MGPFTDRNMLYAMLTKARRPRTGTICSLLFWVALISICIGEPTITEIKNEGFACASIATTFQNLQELTG
jgi:hypothetical protein